jgi:hypothetical protein
MEADVSTRSGFFSVTIFVASDFIVKACFSFLPRDCLLFGGSHREGVDGDAGECMERDEGFGLER